MLTPLRAVSSRSLTPSSPATTPVNASVARLPHCDHLDGIWPVYHAECGPIAPQRKHARHAAASDLSLGHHPAHDGQRLSVWLPPYVLVSLAPTFGSHHCGS